MKAITKYFCDYCGARFDDEEKCKTHEIACGTEKTEIGKRLAKEFDDLLSKAKKAHIKVDYSMCSEDLGGTRYDIEKEKIILFPF